MRNAIGRAGAGGGTANKGGGRSVGSDVNTLGVIGGDTELNELTDRERPSVAERESERTDDGWMDELDSFDKIYAAPPSYNSLSAKSGFRWARRAAQPLDTADRKEISRGGGG